MDEAEKVALLIVDDETPIRELLAKVAARAGFAVDSARDGIEALEMLARKDYEIAIVDLMMPRLSGYDLVQKISTLQPRPAVLVATALTNGDTGSLDDSMVRRVIRKPFDIKSVAQALIDTAKQIVEERQASVATPEPETPTPVEPTSETPPRTVEPE